MLHDLGHGFPDERSGAFRRQLGNSLELLTIKPALGYTPPVRDGEIWALISGYSDAAIIHALITVTGAGPT